MCWEDRQTGGGQDKVFFLAHMRGGGLVEKKTKKELLEIAKKYEIENVNQRMLKEEIFEIVSANVQRASIRADLLDQLERNMVVGEFYTDLVNDYMAMWDVKNSLIDDINNRGVTVEWQNGEHQKGYRKNDSVAELQRTNNQMLRLLDHLGIKPSAHEGTEYNYDDLEM